MFAKDADITEAFEALQPFSDFVLTKSGKLMAAMEFTGIDPDALTQRDYASIAYLGRRIVELLPLGSSVTQYYIHHDNQPIELRDRGVGVSGDLSRQRVKELSERGVSSTKIIHVYTFSDPDSASTSLMKDLFFNLPLAPVDPQARQRVKDRFRFGGSLLLNRALLEKMAASARTALGTIEAQWSKIAPIRRLSSGEFWQFQRYVASFDPEHLRIESEQPEDDLDLGVAPGEIQQVTLGFDPALKISGSPSRFVRFGSILKFGREPMGWLTSGVHAPLYTSGDYMIVSHFTALSDTSRMHRFFEAKSSLQRSRISLIRMLKGETQEMDEETGRRFRREIDRLDIAEASDDLWGLAFNTVVVAHHDPQQMLDTAQRLHTSLVSRNVSLVWEDAGLPMVYRAVQPGGFEHSMRHATVSSTRMGFTAPAFRSSEGQKVVPDLGNEEAVYVFETETGEPFYYSGHVMGRNFTVGVGPSRSGKTYLKNTVSTAFMKYVDSRVRAIDIDPGMRFVTEHFGGDGGYVDFADEGLLNPFAVANELEKPEDDPHLRIHLSRLLALMLEANTAEEDRSLTPAEQHDIDRSVLATLRMPGEHRTLAALLDHMGRDLRRKFARWDTSGPYGSIFGADEDGVSTRHRITAWNLQTYRDNPVAIRPILFELFYRTTREFEDPRLRGTAKVLEIDEAHYALSIPEFREYIVTKMRTWGKWGGGISLWTQSPEDYLKTAGWDAIRGAATSFVFLPDGNLDEDLYRQTFRLGDGELEAIKGLSRGQAFIIQPELDIRKKVLLRVDPIQHVLNTSLPIEVEIRARRIAEHGREDGLLIAAEEIAQTNRVGGRHAA